MLKTKLTSAPSSLLPQSYSGLRGAVAFSLAYSRVIDVIDSTAVPESEKKLRESMLTAVTVLVLFTVFVQVREGGRE